MLDLPRFLFFNWTALSEFSRDVRNSAPLFMCGKRDGMCEDYSVANDSKVHKQGNSSFLFPLIFGRYKESSKRIDKLPFPHHIPTKEEN